MNKKYSLLIAFLITGLIASNIYLLSIQKKQNSLQSAILARVIDGDTIVLDDGRTIRLLNINSPEKGVHGAELSKSFLKERRNIVKEIIVNNTRAM